MAKSTLLKDVCGLLKQEIMYSLLGRIWNSQDTFGRSYPGIHLIISLQKCVMDISKFISYLYYVTSDRINSLVSNQFSGPETCAVYNDIIVA